jgi:AcrR family transcriptional regulator
MKSAQKSPAPRKTPVQSRGRERVERLLDAAAHVFADVGYEAATTDGIAAQAGASIGSLYQFFPNKQALFDAVAKRHLQRASELFDVLLAAHAKGTPWDEMLDRAIDGFAALDRSDPNMRAVWRNWQVAGSFVVASEALNRDFARRTEAVFARPAGVPRAKRRLVSTMVVEVITAMLFVVARRPAHISRALLDETKVMLRRYIEPYVSPRH